MMAGTVGRLVVEYSMVDRTMSFIQLASAQERVESRVWEISSADMIRVASWEESGSSSTYTLGYTDYGRLTSRTPFCTE